MTLMHKPITREQQIAGMANMIAFDCSTNAERHRHINGIRRKQGDAMADAVRDLAWKAMQAGVRNPVLEMPTKWPAKK